MYEFALVKSDNVKTVHAFKFSSFYASSKNYNEKILILISKSFKNKQAASTFCLSSVGYTART